MSDSNDDLDVASTEVADPDVDLDAALARSEELQARIEAFVRANDERRGNAPVDETCISEPLAEALRLLAESRAILEELIAR